MTATAAAIKRLDDLFQNIRLEEQTKNGGRKKCKEGGTPERVHFNPIVITKDCDIHGKRHSHLNNGGVRRGSIELRREAAPAGAGLGLNSIIGSSTKRNNTPPSSRDSRLSNNTLRKDSTNSSSTNSLRRDNNAKKDTSFSTLKKEPLTVNENKTTPSVISHKDGAGLLARRFSTDSLDSAVRRNSWETRRESSGSSAGFDDPIWEENNITKNTRQEGDGQSSNGNKPKFQAVTTLEDAQAIRCAEFHPQGNLYAVGSNSKILRICAYPKLHDLRDNHKTNQPTVLFKRTKHHKGSIYCMAWTPIGDLLATGSNDKTIKLMRFNNDTANFEGQEIELAMHDGTVRDVCFLEDTSNKASLLISGGAGDCKIYVTDCATGQPYQAFSGHCGHVLSLYNWGGVMFVSGSQDRTVRFWDLRTRSCANTITPTTTIASKGSPVAAVCVDPSGRLLVTGHEDSSCVLYDIRGSRPLQCFKPHTSDVRSIRFSPSAYYLLTGGYDNKIVLTDLQGDLTSPLPSVVVAQHQDKVISGRWHPAEFSFLSTSADKTSSLWALPSLNNTESSVISWKKSSKKSNTKTTKISQVFRRSKDHSSCLFGILLCKLTDGETLPKPIISMLYQVFAKGPFIQGIFRKSANARQVRELRDKLDAGVEVTWEVPVLVTAALLKDFLRSLPEPLLTTALYPEWRAAVETPNLNTKLYQLKRVVEQLPKPNHLLLIHFLCVLHHIAKRSRHTLMSAANLAVCVGPSLLWSSDSPNVADDLRIVPSIVESLITHCEYLCGSHVPGLFGDLRDSGAEESDSMKRDDSSTDSLDCNLLTPQKDKMSLSRDSGLTMSDSQLYTPDEEESGWTSSSGCDPDFESYPKVSSSTSMAMNYVRVYGGWEERLNPNYFQRQAWFRQRSRRNATTSNKSDARRSLSEDCLLDSSPNPRHNKAHEYDLTPIPPHRSSVIRPRRLDLPTATSSSKSVDGDDEYESPTSPSQPTTVHFQKELDVKPSVPSAKPFNVDRCSLPVSAMKMNCDNVNETLNQFSNVCLNSSSLSRPANERPAIIFSCGEHYCKAREQVEDTSKNVECLDSQHVFRSNPQGNERVSKFRYSSPPVHVRVRVKHKEERAAHRNRSLPLPPPYRLPPSAPTLEDCNKIVKNYVITRTYMGNEESYV